MEPTAQRRIVRFGIYEADLETRRLTKSGFRIRLQDQPFQILALLLERPGQIVTRDELKQNLWPGNTFVEFDDGLNTAIKKLRTALNDSADTPRFIETIPRRGYRLLVSVNFPAVAELPDKGRDSPDTLSGSELERTRIRPWWLWVSSVAAVLLIFAGIYRTHGRRVASVTKLSEKDTIVLADFVNTTGEPVFDGTLKQALAVELGQSPFLNVASDLQVGETLHLMGRSPSDPLTREVAREVCLRMGSKAIISGSISNLGSHYVVGLEALGCSNSENLAKEQGEAANKENVLKELSGVASRMRSQVGESIASLQKFDFPVDATTTSLEALKAYSLGAKTVREKGEAEGIPFFQHALQLDPNFALAYASLGKVSDNLGEEKRAVENYTKAFALRDHVSERERYHIVALYHSSVTGDLEQTREACELWTQSYPRDPIARGMLATVFAYLGQFDKSSAEFQQALRLSPETATSYGNLATTQMAQGRLEEAMNSLQKALDQKLDGVEIHVNLYSLAFLRGDAPEMARQVAWAVGKLGDESQLLALQSDTEAYYGRLGKARELSRRAVDSAVREGDKETAANWRIEAALRESEIGNRALAAHDARAAIALAPTRDVKTLAALAMARTGDVAGANRLIRELERLNPDNTILKFYWLPTLKASLELDAGKPQAAISFLQVAAPYEMGEAAYVSSMYPAYRRGQAYLLAHDGPAAATEFKKLLDHPGIVQNDILGVLSRLQLARAVAMTGDKEAARKQYSDFLALWKDADPDIPILKEATAEYAKLQ